MSRELVIIGGGVSGLGFAHMALRRGLQPLVIEATDRVGGALHSHRFDGIGDGYWTELGAHTCFNSYGVLLEILDDLGLTAQLRPKASLPFQLLADGRLISVLRALSLPQLLLSAPRILWLRRKNCSIEEFFGGLVGRRNYEQVIGPALDALTCQPAGQLPADAVFVAKPRRKDVVRSFTGPAGLGSLIDPIAEEPGLELRLATRVERIDSSNGGYHLTLGDGERLQADTLVLAVDVASAARLLQHADADLARLCGSIGVAPIDSLAVVFEQGRSAVRPLGGIIGRADDFYSAASRDGVADAHYRSFAFHFRPGLEPRQRLARACDVLGLRPGEAVAHAEKSNLLPALRKGHARLVADFDRGLAGGRLGLVGNYFRAMGIDDCLSRARDEFARLYPTA